MSRVDFCTSIRRLQYVQQIAQDAGMERGFHVAKELKNAMAAGNVGINEWFASTSHSSLSSTIIEKGNFIDVLQMLPCWSKIDVSESEIEDLFRFISIASENPQYFTQKNLVDVFLDIAHIPVAINQSVIASDIIPDILQIIGKQSDSSSRIRDIFQDLDKPKNL